MSNKYTGLTHRALGHILEWGKQLSKTEGWTKSDANTYTLVEKEIKRIHRARYQKEKAIKMNPYLDPHQPYHTT